MKADVLTLAAVVFSVGVVITMVGFDRAFAASDVLPATPLQQGVISR